MYNLDIQQTSVANKQLNAVQNRIKQLQLMIQGQDVSQLKKNFIGQQIKQLNIIKQSLQQMLKKN